MQSAKNRRDRFLESEIPILIALIANFAIFFSTLFVISIFPRNPNLPLAIDNSPQNFPLGSLTAAFSPDTGVFLDFSSWRSWYLLTIANFAVFFALFVFLNWSIDRRERGIRFLLYSIVFLFLPVLANILNLLLIGQSTLGPSGAFYSSVGLLAGFGMVNLWAGDKSGGLRNMLGRSKRLDAAVLVLNGAIGTGFLMLSFVDPTDFFSESAGGYLVGYGIHMFCFYSAIGACLLLGCLRRSQLIQSRSEEGEEELELNSPDSERSNVDQSNALDD